MRATNSPMFPLLGCLVLCCVVLSCLTVCFVSFVEYDGSGLAKAGLSEAAIVISVRDRYSGPELIVGRQKRG